MSDENVLLLANANKIKLDLARNLLAEAGIPCVVEGPDFDVAELGRAAHDMIRGQNLLVPRSALERARAILDDAWSGASPELDHGIEEGSDEVPGRPAARSWARSPVITFALVGLVLVLGVLWIQARTTAARAEQSDPLFEVHYYDDHIFYVWRATGHVAQEIFDDDWNGSPEHIRWYDHNGTQLSESWDRDEDGIWEASQHFDREGRLCQVVDDFDGDGRSDRIVEHRPSGVRIEWLDDDGDGSFERRKLYDGEGRLVRTEEDREIDGWLELSR